MPEDNKTAFIFPGQGSQSVGMGRDIYDTFTSARAVFAEADEATKAGLTHLIFDGPEEDLLQTINTQPAIVTVSLACLKAIEEVTEGNDFPFPVFAAGHSLGEYAALAAAGTMDFRTAIYLVRERGRLMYEAGRKNPGAMAAVLGLDENTLVEVCRETGTVIANYNCPGQLVISGAKENVAMASELAKARGAARVRPLQVSGAFHSSLMEPAMEGLSQIVSEMRFNTPSIPVIANVSAGPITSVDQIKPELINQLNHGVQWQRSVEYMINNGVKTFFEIGPGKVLAGLIKRINGDVRIFNINNAQSIREITSLKG